jgi:hypothetical protein
LFGVEILERAWVRMHGIDIFLADDPTQQQLLVGGSDRVEPRRMSSALPSAALGPSAQLMSDRDLSLQFAIPRPSAPA